MRYQHRSVLAPTIRTLAEAFGNKPTSADARLAVKNQGFVVTMDVDDFEIVKREMPKLDIVSADYFFS